MIKEGKIKLLLETYELLGLKNVETEEEEVQTTKRTHYVPFIAYTRGSYFGDTDVFQTGLRSERDATAKADLECDFFVISRADIAQLKKTFPKEFKEMQKLAF